MNSDTHFANLFPPNSKIVATIPVCGVIRLIFLLALFSGLTAPAQVPLPQEMLATTSRLFDNFEQHPTLHCSIVHFNPFLDFTFRYEAGFLISVRPEDFTPGGAFGAFLRVTPQGGKPEFYAEKFDVPPIPAMMAKQLSPKQLKKIALQTSAGFAIGDGRYSIDVLLMDRQNHACHTHWNLKTPKHNQPLTLPPNTVSAIAANPWDGKLQSNGIRLTVLLHVAPMNPFATKLHAWDRGFLLQLLACTAQAVALSIGSRDCF